MRVYKNGGTTGTTDTYSNTLNSRRNLVIGAKSSTVDGDNITTAQNIFFKGKISEIHIGKITNQATLIANQKAYYSVV